MSDAQVRQAAWSYVLDEPVRILVADDDPILCEFASVHLSTPTATVVTVPHGLAALDLLRDHRRAISRCLTSRCRSSTASGCWQTSGRTRRSSQLPVMMLPATRTSCRSIAHTRSAPKAFAPKPVNWRLLSYQIRYVLRSLLAGARRSTRQHRRQCSSLARLSTKLRRQCDAILRRSAARFAECWCSAPGRPAWQRIAKLASAALGEDAPGHLCSSRRSPTWMNEANAAARQIVSAIVADVAFGRDESRQHACLLRDRVSDARLGGRSRASTMRRRRRGARQDAGRRRCCRALRRARVPDGPGQCRKGLGRCAATTPSQIQGAAVDVAVDATALTVRVTMDKDVQNLFGQLGWGNITHVKTSATAKMTNGLPLCLLALEPRAERRDHAAEERAADRAGLRRQLQLDEPERPDLDG